MHDDLQSRIEITEVSSYDPIVKLTREQQTFNDAWVGHEPQRGCLQRIGFLTLSLCLVPTGIWGMLNTYLAAKQGVIYLFLVAAAMVVLGVLGIVKALRR